MRYKLVAGIHYSPNEKAVYVYFKTDILKGSFTQKCAISFSLELYL